MLFDIIGKFNGASGTALQSGVSDEEAAPSAIFDPVARLAPRTEALRILPKTQAPALSITPKSGTLDSGVEIKGTLKSSHDLYFNGRIEGEIHSGGTLTVGENACVNGSINSRSVVILGKVEGTVAVQERCELTDTANVCGDITAGSLSIEEGASFIGQSRAGKQSVAAVPMTIAEAAVTTTSTPAPVIRLAA